MSNHRIIVIYQTLLVGFGFVNRLGLGYLQKDVFMVDVKNSF